MLDRWLSGGVVGGLGLTAMMPEWPMLAANQVQFAINTAIGISSFAASAVLSATLPATASFSLPAVLTSSLPAFLGILVTLGLIILRGGR